MAQTPADILQLAISGHSFLITGQCGTGKTSLLKEVIKQIPSQRNVAITATTGMASLQLGSAATTLHHWSGICDGRYTKEKLAELFDNDDQYTAAKARISKTDCLIIDEISMLSKKTFELVEFVCRHVKQSDRCFGNIQVIGCGDFKQLPPVPNKYVHDPGEYCFESLMFDAAFPHHINLTEVKRQNEPDLIKAVNELCDGSPSPETVQMLKELDRPLDNIPAEDITRLYGTNFDARFVNEEMLEAAPGEIYLFKATDEGNTKLLKTTSVPKTLTLKEGAPVILTKNLGKGLFNGQRGIVHKLERGKGPVINFNGRLHEMKPERFEIFDVDSGKVVASRLQIPVILSYALTVHRAQGQTVRYVEVDCASFFAPGQMGVAVGRAISKSGLRVLNFNREAADMKHPPVVRRFYEKLFQPVSPDLSCCTRNINFLQQHAEATRNFGLASAHLGSENRSVDSLEPSNECSTSFDDFPETICPFQITDFLDSIQQTEVNEALGACKVESVDTHFHFPFWHVQKILTGKLCSSVEWTAAYKKLNSFLVSEQHTQSIKKLFSTSSVSKSQNKASTKIAFWQLDQLIKLKTKSILERQEQQLNTVVTAQPSDAAKAKIRYVAGACIQKIRTRLRNSVTRNLGKFSKLSKIAKKVDYRKEKILKTLQVREEDVDSNDPSMAEIQYKQGISRGLTVVSEGVFQFFLKLNAVMNNTLSVQNLHLNIENIHLKCRNATDGDEQLRENWVGLFGNFEDDTLEDELIITFINDLFSEVTEYFIRLSLVDSIKELKYQLPRKKKQPLRAKLQALGEKESRKRRLQASSESDDTYICLLCGKVCEEEPSEMQYSSVGCDRCNNWFHYACVNLSGNEPVLTSSSAKWYCYDCRKGKGKGKGKATKK